jgi:hypothetical protein
MPRPPATLLLLFVLLGCGRPVPAAQEPASSNEPYGYENDDDPLAHDDAESPECDLSNCKPPLVCAHVITDTTVAVPNPKAAAHCVSRDSDLCRMDAAACTNPGPPISIPCSLDDMEAGTDDERALLQNIARRCSPFDRCLLACIRSGCASTIGGGCFHTCSVRGSPAAHQDAVLLKEAVQYRAGTHYFCRRKRDAK